MMGVTADTALRLARYFGTTPRVWLNLQKTYELRQARPMQVHASAHDTHQGEINRETG